MVTKLRFVSEVDSTALYHRYPPKHETLKKKSKKKKNRTEVLKYFKGDTAWTLCLLPKKS